jgi:hypothetical protein
MALITLLDENRPNLLFEEFDAIIGQHFTEQANDRHHYEQLNEKPPLAISSMVMYCVCKLLDH